MDIIFYCPECGQKIEAPEEYRGVEVVCPTCNNTILVPIKRNNAPIRVTQIAQNSPNSQPEYSASVFTILGLFFGIFGAHNFYKKQYFWGITRIVVIIISIITMIVLHEKSITIDQRVKNAYKNYADGRYTKEIVEKFSEEKSKMNTTLAAATQIILILHIASCILVIVELAFQNMPTTRPEKTSR
jgi:TM2 domain-containing membrane protein YozV/DNA-directed RNA polymerase subunit RPC12/RpoP